MGAKDEPIRACATQEARRLMGEGCGLCESPSLRLTKFLRVGGTVKAEEVRAVVDCHAKHAKVPPELPEPKGAIRVWARLKSRLLVNLAGGILENANIALDPHFGVPYLPGSAVKGIARHAAWCEWVGADKDAAVAKEIAAVFGFPTGDGNKGGLDERLKGLKQSECAGCVAFLPAYPKDKATLEVDVTTCHHKDYYAKKPDKPKATDDEQPNPQFFPAVASDTVFRFTLVPLRGCTPAQLARAKGWLVRALAINGAGAKTAAGYGWFEDVTKTEEEAYLRTQADRERRKQLEELKAWIAAFAPPEADAAIPAAIQEVEAKKAEASSHKADPVLVRRFDDALNALKKRLPQESPLDRLRKRWAKENQIERDAKDFLKKSPETQALMVTLFLEPGSLARQVYARIRNGIKGFDGPTQQAIVAAVKARNGGKA